MRRFLFVILACLWPSVSAASASVCERMTAAAEARYEIPQGLLTAIARAESGRATDGVVQAWPWTLNVAGEGFWFDSEEAALAHLDQVLSTGHRNVDLGCMQINWRWHADNFADARTMMNPQENIDYAAQYLRQLRDETGSWDSATRRYHSRDPDRGARYLARVSQHRSRIDQQPAEVSRPARAADAGDRLAPLLARLGDSPLPNWNPTRVNTPDNSRLPRRFADSMDAVDRIRGILEAMP